MYRIAALSFLASVLAPSALCAATGGAVLMEVTIVKPDSGQWLAEHAAGELAKYVKRMTGASARITGRQPNTPAGPVFVLRLGGAADGLKQLPGAEDRGRLRDGFAIRSLGQGRLSISALEPIGLLYGVYEYLEDYCGVGFFWDGDYVPRRGDLPLDGIDRARLPRWPVRHFGLSTTWGLSKWHHQFRSLEERKRIADWMAKRKINRTHHDFSPIIAKSGISAARVYGISDKEPDNFTFAGWPGCLDWPAEVRTRILQGQFRHSRKLGITWAYYLAFGSLPHQFRQMHPEYKYVGHLGYSATILYPDDPEAARWSKAFYKDIIETYGTDHIYQDTPFVESAGAAEAEKSFRLKLKAAQQMCKVFKELDKQAVWQSDSWDFGAQAGVWTPERIRRYFTSLPQDMMLIYDTAGMGNPFYKRTDYFGGTRWAFGILHSFQGDDHLHGSLDHAISAIRAVSEDPGASKCVGIYHVPECCGHNVLFFHLTTRLAWDPAGVSKEQFLVDYTKRRYGPDGYEGMRPAVDALVKAVYEGGGQMPIYQKLGCPYGPREWWPILDDRQAGHPARKGAGIRDLKRALDLALKCRRTQQHNPLYENDMVDWTRTCLAHVFNWATLEAYRAFREGDAAALKSRIALARLCLRHIEAVLSTRRDFSLQAQIDWAMSIPGANPHLPWYMKQHCVNDLYSSNEVYEQLHWYYAPRMEIYFSELEKRATDGTRKIAWADIAERCGAVHNRWLNEEIRIPEGDRFAGTTMAAVMAAFEALNRSLKDLPKGDGPD